MTIDEHISYWIRSAEHDIETVESLFVSKKFDWCLFIGHLILEKSLKAIYVKNSDNRIPPKIHNLVRLAEISGLYITKDELYLGGRNEKIYLSLNAVCCN